MGNQDQPVSVTDLANIPFADRAITTSDGAYQYQIFIPPQWSQSEKWPVIVFLHGAGPRGDDNRAQTRTGIRLLIAQAHDRFPALVVCPQCRTGARWTRPDMDMMVLTALDQSIQEFNGDPDRVYLTGLSLGGYATWELARRHPDRWAAIVPCCGGVLWRGERVDALPTDTAFADPYATMASTVAAIPAWVFHGQADPTVPVSESRQMVAVLHSLEADVRYTEYPNIGHDSWDKAYTEPNLLGWLLSHKRT